MAEIFNFSSFGKGKEKINYRSFKILEFEKIIDFLSLNRNYIH
jgi:hypothetical protein